MPFANMLMDIKLSKSPLPTVIQSVGFLGKTLGNLGKKVLLDLAVPLAKDVLPKLATKVTLCALDKFERKVSRKGARRAGRGFTLFQMKIRMVFLKLYSHYTNQV